MANLLSNHLRPIDQFKDNSIVKNIIWLEKCLFIAVLYSLNWANNKLGRFTPKGDNYPSFKTLHLFTKHQICWLVNRDETNATLTLKIFAPISFFSFCRSSFQELAMDAVELTSDTDSYPIG